MSANVGSDTGCGRNCRGSGWNRKSIFTSGFVEYIVSSECWPMSGSDSSATLTSDMVEIGGCRWNRVTIAFRSKIISTSGFVAEILSSGCRPISDMFSRAISKPSMVTNVGKPLNRVEIAFCSKVILSSGLYRRHLEFLMSADVESRRLMSGMVENVGVAVEIASLPEAFQKLLPLPF